MQLSQIPTLVPLPFAASGNKNVIPQASQIGITPGAASLVDGFPPLTFTPLAAGGIPPAGADFNGILNLLSANTQWQNAGGFSQYNAAFSTAVGGYPKTALLAKASGSGYWLSLADNNATDPDTGGAGWIAFDPWAIQAAQYITAPDTGAVNAYAVALTPTPIALTPGMMVSIKSISNTNTGAATLAVNGLGTLPILLAKNTPLIGGELVAGYGAICLLNNAGTAWELIWTGAGSFGIVATTSNQAVNLSQVASVAPMQSQHYYIPASGGTYTQTVSFTAPSNGFIVGIATQNNASDPQPAPIEQTLSINGTNYGTDTTTVSKSNYGVASVSAGTACTVTNTLVVGTSTSTFLAVSQTVVAIFTPNP